MDQQLIALFGDGKLLELERMLKNIKIDDLTSLIDRRTVRGKGDPAVLLRAVFSGSPASSDDGVKRRLLVLKHWIDIFQSHDLGSKITAELIGILLGEVDSFPAASLADLANYYIDGIKSNIITSSRCLELFPKILSALEAKDVVATNGSEMKGAEFKTHILNSLCSCRWESNVVLHLVAMLRDVALSVDELGHVIAKTVRQFRDVDLQELPPLIYQLLLLSTKGHKKMVLVGVITHFVEQDAKHLTKSADKENEGHNTVDSLETVSADELHHVEGTVILHVTFAIKQDQQLGREFIKYFKSYQLFALSKVLSPFNVALALSLGRIHSFEEQVFELLKSAVIKSYRDADRCRLSRWVRDVTCIQPDAAEQILDTIKNSIAGWDHITQGLVQLGFALMEAYGPRLTAGKTSTPGHRVQNPSQAACQLGVRILLDTFRVHEAARNEIIERLVNCIITRTAAPVSHYLDVLSMTVKNSPHVVLESLPRLREAFDYLMFLPPSSAEGFLSAIRPLLKLNASLRDSLVIVLRKAIFSRQIESRRVAVTGFLMLLNNYQVLGGSILSSQSSQNSCFSNSQVQADVHFSRNAPYSEALCLEIINTIKRCLTQQAEVRLILYEGLYDVLRMNAQLTDSVINILLDQFRAYYESQVDVNPPLKLDGCIVLQCDQPYVVEPLAHLLSSLTHCLLLKKQQQRGAGDQSDDDADEDSDSSVSAAEDLVTALVQRMIKCEPEDFELDKSADFSALTSVGIRNTILALLVCGLYEVLIEYEFLSSNFDVSRCQQVVKLFQNYQRISDVLKEKPATATAGKKRGRQQKDSATTSAAPAAGDAPASSGKTTGGLLSIDFISKALTAIYSDNVPSHHEANAILSANFDLQRHLVSSAVTKLQHIAQHGYCDGLDGHNNERLVKYCNTIGQILFKQYSASISTSVSSTNATANKSAGDSVKNRAFVSSCLEGFAQITMIFCTRYSHHLKNFLQHLEKRRASDKSVSDETDEQALITKHIQRLQRMTVAVVTSASDVRPVHDVAVLLSMIGVLTNLLNTNSPAALTDIDDWLQRLCKEQSIDDPTVVKALLQQSLTVARQQVNAVELCRDVARDVHICLGDIDQEVEVDASKKAFGVVGLRVAPSVVQILASHLELEIDDAEWIITRMKAESMEQTDVQTDSTQNETVEKSVCMRLGHVINTCHELLQTALPLGACVDCVMRVVCRLYVVLTLLVKWSLSLYVRKIGQMSGRFEKLVKLSGTNLTQSVYPMITYVQMSQSEKLQMDADKVTKKKTKNKSLVPAGDKTRILKETRSIPNLIYSIEQYEKFLIQLSKKSKVDLMAHFKMSTSRDFRINAASLQAAIERAAQQDEESDTGADVGVDADSNDASVVRDDDSPSAKRKRPAAAASGPSAAKGGNGKGRGKGKLAKK